MRLSLLVSAAATLGCLLPTSLSAQEQPGSTDLRTEIRKIVREEIRAALREMRADSAQQARPGATARPLPGASVRPAPGKEAKERAAAQLEVEIEGMDHLIQQIDQEVQKHEQSLRQISDKKVEWREVREVPAQRSGAVVRVDPQGKANPAVGGESRNPQLRGVRVVQEREGTEQPVRKVAGQPAPAGQGIQFDLGDLKFDGQVQVQFDDGKPMAFVMEGGELKQVGGDKKPAGKTIVLSENDGEAIELDLGKLFGGELKLEGGDGKQLMFVMEDGKVTQIGGDKAPVRKTRVRSEKEGEGVLLNLGGLQLQVGDGERKPATKAKATKPAKAEDIFEIELQGPGDKATAGCRCNCPCCGNQAKAAGKSMGGGMRMFRGEPAGEQDGKGEAKVFFYEAEEARPAKKATAGKRAKGDDDDDDAEEAKPAKKAENKVQFFGVPAGKPSAAAKAKSKGGDEDDDDDDDQPSKVTPPAKPVPATPTKPGTLRIRQLLV